MASVRFLTAALAPLVIAALPAAAAAQTAPYKEGSVWAVTLVRVKPGMEDDYLNNLRASWQRTLQEAKRQGLLLSWRVISANAATPEDWNLMLMVEYRNMAALDGVDDKFRAIAEKMIGSEQQQRTAAVRRADIREILGDKLGRELVLRDSTP